MNPYGELEWRGLVYDATEGLRDLLDRETVSVYSGFDPTAPSLHVGHLLPALALARLQRLGHRPIAVVGGGTGLIGDPSGKNTERALLSVEQVEAHVASIRQQLADPQTPAVLRLELGRILQLHQELDPALLEKMLDPGTPATLRLIACESILSQEKESMLRESAISGLKDLARLPNREIALGTADVVQRRLGVDLGIGLGQPLPPANSRQATDIIRRVMAWASQGEDDLEQSGGPRNSRWAI